MLHSQEETRKRLAIIENIVKDCFSSTGKVLTTEESETYAEQWDKELQSVATKQLAIMHCLGMKRGCRTAAQFVSTLESYLESLCQKYENASSETNVPKVKTNKSNIPDFLLEQWKEAA